MSLSDSSVLCAQLIAQRGPRKKESFAAECVFDGSGMVHMWQLRHIPRRSGGAGQTRKKDDQFTSNMTTLWA